MLNQYIYIYFFKFFFSLFSEKQQVIVDGDERVTTTIGPTLVSSSSSRNADALTTVTSVTSVGKITLTISQAKERLKARRIKSRKVKQTPKEEEEEEQHQGHYNNKKMDSNIFRDESLSIFQSNIFHK